MPLEKVTREDTANPFNFIAPKNPAITLSSKVLTTPCIIMFPIEMKLCCNILGTAIIARLFNKLSEKTGKRFPSPIFFKRTITARTARIPLIPWQRKVAHATPATPILKTETNKISTPIFDNEEAARERFESLVKEDKKFLAEEGRDDTIEEDEDSYCSFPDGEYSTTHYWVSLLKTKNA